MEKGVSNVVLFVVRQVAPARPYAVAEKSAAGVRCNPGRCRRLKSGRMGVCCVNLLSLERTVFFFNLHFIKL